MTLARCRVFAASLIVSIAATFSPLVAALGLGEITLNSSLNEPLDASIELLQLDGLNPDQIRVGLGTREDFERAGLEFFPFLETLEFEVITQTRDRGELRLTSQRPVVEPYVSLLVDIRWPGGRMMREYTTLVDPPLYSVTPAAEPTPPQAPDQTESPVSPEAADPALAGSPQNETPADGLPAPDADDRPAPADVAPADDEPEVASTTRQSDTATAGADSEGGEPVAAGPEGEDTTEPVETTAGAGEYQVRDNDTLWQIALQTRPGDEVSVQQMMLAIQRDNEQAFIGGNINRLCSGEVLRIPRVENRDLPSQAQAVAEVGRQNRQAGLTGSAPLTPAASGPAGPAGASDELRVLTAEGVAEAGAGASDLDERIAALEMELMMVEEEQDRARLENRELVARLDEVNSQVELLENIIDIEDQRIAELQEALAERAAAEAEAAAAAAEAARRAAETQVSGPDSEEAPAGGLLRNPLLLGGAAIVLIGLVIGLLVLRRRREEALEEDDFGHEYDTGSPLGQIEIGGAAASTAMDREAAPDDSEAEEGRDRHESADDQTGDFDVEEFVVDDDDFDDDEEEDLDDVYGESLDEDDEDDQDDESDEGDDDFDDRDERTVEDDDSEYEEDDEDDGRNRGILSSLGALMSGFSLRRRRDAEVEEDMDDHISEGFDHARDLPETAGTTGHTEFAGGRPGEGGSAGSEQPGTPEVSTPSPVGRQKDEDELDREFHELIAEVDRMTDFDTLSDSRAERGAISGSPGDLSQDAGIESEEASAPDTLTEDLTAGEVGQEADTADTESEAPEQDFVEFNLATAATEDSPSGAAEGQAGEAELETFDFRLDDVLQDIDESSDAPQSGQAEQEPEDFETFEFQLDETSPEETAGAGNTEEDATDLGNLTFDENDLAADDSDEDSQEEDEPSDSSRIDLAVAYEAMGDLEGARSILQGILKDGEEADRSEAQRLLDEWGHGGNTGD